MVELQHAGPPPPPETMIMVHWVVHNWVAGWKSIFRLFSFFSTRTLQIIMQRPDIFKCFARSSCSTTHAYTGNNISERSIFEQRLQANPWFEPNSEHHWDLWGFDLSENEDFNIKSLFGVVLGAQSSIFCGTWTAENVLINNVSGWLAINFWLDDCFFNSYKKHQGFLPQPQRQFGQHQKIRDLDVKTSYIWIFPATDDPMARLKFGRL